MTHPLPLATDPQGLLTWKLPPATEPSGQLTRRKAQSVPGGHVAGSALGTWAPFAPMTSLVPSGVSQSPVFRYPSVPSRHPLHRTAEPALCPSLTLNLSESLNPNRSRCFLPPQLFLPPTRSPHAEKATKKRKFLLLSLPSLNLEAPGNGDSPPLVFWLTLLWKQDGEHLLTTTSSSPLCTLPWCWPSQVPSQDLHHSPRPSEGAKSSSLLSHFLPVG